MCSVHYRQVLVAHYPVRAATVVDPGELFEAVFLGHCADREAKCNPVAREGRGARKSFDMKMKHALFSFGKI